MTSDKKHVFGDDLPKENPWQDDRLGYAPFAKRISRVLIDLAAPNGYVIGLHGQWGSGKSTAINFILAYLKKHNAENEDDQISHIDFRPWIVSGHQDLIVAFFKILSENLGPKEGTFARLWKWLVHFLHGKTDNLVDAAATVALSVDPTGGTASQLAQGLAKKSINALIRKFLEEPSLQAAYQSLKEQLGRSNRRFVVTIDDIDRLNDDDVRAIMQMVKSIGRLPNVVYLLSYDREIIWAALDQTTNRPGPRFAEKIVQQEIELPKISQNALLTLLDEEIAFLLQDTPDSIRWQFIIRDGIRRWIQSPRDIIRTANAIKFAWPAIEGELDRQDLLAMEGLRLFDAAAFYWLRDNRDFIFNDGRFILADDELKNEAIEILKRRIVGDVSPQILRILSVLFPHLEKLLGDKNSFGGETDIEVAKRRGIGSEAGYDTYFGLHPSPDAISNSLVTTLIERENNSTNIEKVFRTYLFKKNSRHELMISKLLEELRVQFRSRNPPQPTQALLDAIFSVGEDIIKMESDGNMFELSPRAQVGFLVRNLLEQWGLEQAGRHLIEAFGSATSPAFMADIYADRGRELNIFAAQSKEALVITSNDFEQLGQILISKIEAAEADGTLAQAPFYFDIVRAWGQLRGNDAPRAWLSKGMTENAIFTAKTAIGLVSYSIGETPRRYTMREQPPNEFYDLSILFEAAKKHLTSSEITEDQANLLKAIVKGTTKILTQINEGHTADGQSSNQQALTPSSASVPPSRSPDMPQ
ncbi:MULTISPECIES: P-loop NTPase fold protein [unclassified Beijerinckia]|uniref:KAP family P-loop NTPase fold protein n=1 Tax=unclassified Beijerinckia TaxID=2638183 RepID=UPI000899AEEF|nr:MULTISPECIES: P-loop NTPase fold protein [unclassified Beijerinckia]MDH7799652.1 ABC-type dipeptide/oligopeptide/nickel transport system ATPase component [Beijerinckia sp. GAS462]SEB48677.1 KAP family P-loop domain-containing protein [Beijerinckia sp. 28-YEA-48]